MKTIYMRESSSQYDRYRRAVTAAGWAVRSDGKPHLCDALLLPGGGDLSPERYGQSNTASYSVDLARDEEELSLLEEFTSLQKPVLGICRGLQLINVFFHGTLFQDIAGHNCTNGIDRLHQVCTLPGSLQALCGTSCIVNSAHHQSICRLGNDLQILQRAPDGTIEAITHETLPILAVQWHPERLSFPHGQQLISWFLAQYL